MLAQMNGGMKKTTKSQISQEIIQELLFISFDKASSVLCFHNIVIVEVKYT